MFPSNVMSMFRPLTTSVMRAGDGDVTTTVGASQDFEVTSSGNSFVADAIANGAVSFSGEAMKDFGGVANIVLTTGNRADVLVTTTAGSAQLRALPYDRGGMNRPGLRRGS